MGSSNSRTLQQSVQWASFYTGNRPLTLQGTNEPAVTAANLIIQGMLAPPMKYNWNRNSIRFQTVDTAIWQGVFTYPAGYRLIDYNGNMQTVLTAGTSGPNPPIWSVVPGGVTIDDTTLTWVMSFSSDYVQSVPDFGFIEQATLQGNSAGAIAMGKVWDIPNKTLTLTADTGKGRWQTIAPYLDDNNGNITFRPMPGMPDQLYTATIIYQQRAELLQGITDFWPIPDMYSHIYNTGFLGMIWLFADNPRSAFMLQRFAAMTIAVSDGLTDQEKNSFLDQWDVLGASRRAQGRDDQGRGARSAS